MRKPFMIASVLLLLTLFAISLSMQEDFNKSKLDEYWHEIEKDNSTVWEVVIFGLKIAVGIITDNYEFINNINDLFVVKTPTEPKLKRKLAKPCNTTITEYKEER